MNWPTCHGVRTSFPSILYRLGGSLSCQATKYHLSVFLLSFFRNWILSIHDLIIEVVTQGQIETWVNISRYFLFWTTETLGISLKEMQKSNRWSLKLAWSILFRRSFTVYFCSVYSPAKHFHTKINSYAAQGEYCSPLLL